MADPAEPGAAFPAAPPPAGYAPSFPPDYATVPPDYASGPPAPGDYPPPPPGLSGYAAPPDDRYAGPPDDRYGYAPPPGPSGYADGPGGYADPPDDPRGYAASYPAPGGYPAPPAGPGEYAPPPAGPASYGSGPDYPPPAADPDQYPPAGGSAGSQPPWQAGFDSGAYAAQPYGAPGSEIGAPGHQDPYATRGGSPWDAAGSPLEAPLPGDFAQPGGHQPPGWGPPATDTGYPGTLSQQHGGPGGPGGTWTGPAAPRKRRGLLIGVVAVVAAVLAAGITSFVLFSSKGESPTAMAQQAATAIAPAPGMALSGTFDNAPAKLTVTKYGTVQGSYSQEAFPATRITISGVTYLNAPAGFWSLLPDISQDAAMQAGGHWAKVPPKDVTSFAQFTPATIARALRRVGSQPTATATMLGHTKVTKIMTVGATYYVTSATPNRLMRIDGSVDGVRYSFTTTALTASTIAPAYAAMHTDVKALQGAQDPQASLTSSNDINFASDCSNSDTSCTVSVDVKVSDPSSAAVLVTMTADFSATKGGKAFGSCNATIPATTANSASAVTVTPKCELSGPPWKKWVDSQTGSFNTWVETSFGAEVNSATDVTTLQNTLTKQQG